jgi:hypothetical protein
VVHNEGLQLVLCAQFVPEVVGSGDLGHFAGSRTSNLWTIVDCLPQIDDKSI